MSQSHQLAAIMFTDLVGYTALMGEDEDKAFQVLAKNRNLQKPLIESYGGQYLKEMGDGILTSFNSASDAVYCALAINKATTHEEDLSLRIGIHLGDVVFQNGDVLGDGVNIASRLQELAPPDGIWVSESVHKNVLNKKGVVSKFAGEEQLKNVKESVRIYNIRMDGDIIQPGSPESKKSSGKYALIALAMVVFIGLAYAVTNYLKNNKSAATEAETMTSDPIEPQSRSIAVLPFSDLSPKGDQEYLGDGVAEEIINTLTQMRDLKVIGRTSSFSFKGKDTDLKTIGETLGVTTILEGSVQKVGDRIKITAQLINAEDGFHLWSEQYDEDLNDIFTIQEDVAEMVASKLIKSRIAFSEKNYQAIDFRVYDFFLKGDALHKKFMNLGNLSDFLLAEKMFSSALDIQPDYVDGHAGLADLYNSITNFYPLLSVENNDHILAFEEYKELQIKEIEIAYQLNPNSDHVHRTMGYIYTRFGDPDSAYIAHKRAIELAPNNPENLIGLWDFMGNIGLDDESLFLLNRAIEKNPLEIRYLSYKATSFYFQGRWDEAENTCKEILKLKPYDRNSLIHLFDIYLFENKLEQAEEIYEQLKPHYTQDSTQLKFLESKMYAAKGEREKALAVDVDHPTPVFSLLLGDKEKALTWIIENQDLFKGHSMLENFKLHDLIRDDPRFKELLVQKKKEHAIAKEKYGDLSFLEEKFE